MNQLPVLCGVIGYEYRMQIRRKALWITFLCFLLLMMVLFFTSPGGILSSVVIHLSKYPLMNIMLGWITGLNYTIPIAIGCLLTDRLPPSLQCLSSILVDLVGLSIKRKM
jgi:ABC-2 type transport system permease protein